MSKLRDAARQALEALEKEPADYADWTRTMKAARAALRTALAEQPEQEPTPDWISYNKHSDVVTIRGRRYSAALFDERGFGSPPGTLLRIVEGPADVVTLERVEGHPAEQEPVAEVAEAAQAYDGKWTAIVVTGGVELQSGDKLYASPQPRKRLTREEIMDAVCDVDLDWHQGWPLGEDAPNRYETLCRAIEAALWGEKT